MEERSIPILGKETINVYQNTHIAIFGLGGVGGYVVEALARQKIGKFSIIDYDVIQVSNKNRQILAVESTIGKPKTEACQQRILDINPEANVHTYCLKIDEATIEQIDFSDVDYIVDCIDDLKGKIAIIKKSKEFHKDIICCCGTANKTNPMKFVIQDISKTSVCPLAKKLRLELKKLDITDVDVLYSTEEPIVKNANPLPTVSFVPSVAGLLIARHILLKIHESHRNEHINLVLEGGGMKGVYSAGVLDFFLEKKLEFHSVYGVSAGACVGASFISKQKTRGFHSLVDYVNDPACVSKKSLSRTGNYFNKEFVYYRIPNELIPFDFDTAHNNPCKLYATVTNVETGKAEYYPCLDYHRDIEYICASSSLPMLAEIQSIEGKLFLDGGISDSIPYLEAKKAARKCVVILTKPEGYLCQKQNYLLKHALRIKYRKYPKLLKSIEQRHLQYNKTLKNLEKDKDIFLIRPSKKLEIGRLEKDQDRLKKTYELGYQDAEKEWSLLQQFLEK